MTPQVAAYARQELVLAQAILARFGALRAMSFRTVTANGSDLYFVHFANGSAEWRIGLVYTGKIRRIALGPQIRQLTRRTGYILHARIPPCTTTHPRRRMPSA